MENVTKSHKVMGVWSFGLAYTALLTPLLLEYFEYLLSRPFYQWAPVFAVLVLGLFTYSWRKALVAETRPPQWLLISIMLFSFLLTGVGYLYYTGWLAMVAAIVAIGALLVYLSGFRRVDRVFGLWALLFFLVRLPNQIETRLLNLFESFSTKIASLVVDYSGTYHVLQSKFMVIDGYEIDIERICNGYFSVFTLAALTGLYALWRRRSLIHVVGLIPSAFIVAAALNVLRVATVAIVYVNTGTDIMQTSWIYALLIVSLGLGLLGGVSVEAFLALLWGPIDEIGGRVDGRSLARLWSWLSDFKIGAFCAKWRRSGEYTSKWRKAMLLVNCVGLLGLAVFVGLILNAQWSNAGEATRFMHNKKEDLAIIDPGAIEFSRPGWEFVSVEEEVRDFKSIWGANSFVWRLQYQDVTVIMALDYPFDKWHDVRVCYSNLGWKIQTMAMSNLIKSTGWGASETEMTLPTGDYGFILCSHTDHLGAKITPKPTASNLNMVGYYLHPKQWQAPFKMDVDKDKNTFYQTQVMVTTPFPLDEPTKQEIRDMYGEFREQARILIKKEGLAK